MYLKKPVYVVIFIFIATISSSSLQINIYLFDLIISLQAHLHLLNHLSILCSDIIFVLFFMWTQKYCTLKKCFCIELHSMFCRHNNMSADRLWRRPAVPPRTTQH